MATNLSVEKSVTRQRVMTPDIFRYADETRKEGIFTDVTIKAETENIPAHRVVLSCCSQFFKNMFSSNFKEQYQDYAEIKGLNGTTVKVLIDFMYSGNIQINNQNVMDLLGGADFLQLDEVKQFCFEFLASVVTGNNCFAILNAAKLYRFESLSRQVYQYIADHLNEIAETTEFMTLSKEDMTSCLSALNRNKVEESSLFFAITAWAKHGNDETRKNDFPDLLQLIQLKKLSVGFLEDVVSIEDLVTENFKCYKLVTATLLSLMKENKVMETSISQKDETRILCLGGSMSTKQVVEISSLYGRATSKMPDLPLPLDYHCSVKWNNRIYCIGGRSKSQSFAVVYQMNPKVKPLAWEGAASMNHKRHSMGATTFEDKIVVAGGFSGWNHNFVPGQFEVGQELASVECLDPKLNAWSHLSPLKRRRCGNALVSCNGYLYALGGWCNDIWLSSVERLNDLNETWKRVAPMQTPRRWLAAVCCKGVIYAIGGRAGEGINNRLKSVEKYDPAKNQWVYVNNMNHVRSGVAACVLNDRIFVVGGIDNHDSPVTSIECYEPSSDTWEIAGQETMRLFNHSLVTL